MNRHDPLPGDATSATLPTSRALALLVAAVLAAGSALPAPGAARPRAPVQTAVLADRRAAAAMLVGYFETMCRPKPFVVRTGAAFEAHRKALRQKVLACAGLWPLPKRVPLDAHASEPLDHEWCTVRRIRYQLWPHVYSSGLLYRPKRLAERPAPAVLCPHGHWANGNAHPEVQKRCLVLAKMGYVVFSSTQHHYEDPALGISHQTLMIWNNIRALDVLQSLPEVDGTRLGCAGASGGGLQAQMLVAVDDRVKAATICGLTCDYREIVFVAGHHCPCNHFPNIMRHTDEPELSALGLPTPVQFLTMNDWTKSFARNNHPAIRRLYEANGLEGRTECRYWPTGHSYDQPKRERTYGWLDKWLRGKGHGGPVPEPPTKTFPVNALTGLKAPVPADKGFRHISRLAAATFATAPPKLRTRAEWEACRHKMRTALRGLLGEPLPARGKPRRVGAEQRDGLVVERILCPSEGEIAVPMLVLRPAASVGKLPAVILCDERGKAQAFSAAGNDSPTARARGGSLVVLPDVRFVGELSLKSMAGLTQELLTFKACHPLGEGRPESFGRVWERNALLWGRPLPGMAATDLRAVVDYLAARPDVDGSRLTLIARGRPAVAGLFAAALDGRVAAVDVDLQGRCFRKRDLPLVPFVLRHGDVLEWAALLADRRLRLAGLAPEAGDPAWLESVFRLLGNAAGLRTQPR